MLVLVKLILGVSRKTQSLNFNNCTRRIQTLPIPKSSVATQSEYINTRYADTMTCNVEVKEASSNTLAAETRHSQTLLIEMDDKATGEDKNSVMCPPEKHYIPPNCKSARNQTDSPLAYLRTNSSIRGQPFSDIWVQSAADFLMDNNNILTTMKQTLDVLEKSCADSSVT